MNARSWRAAGFATLFRGPADGFAERVVVLVECSTGESRMAPVAKGGWMRLSSFSDFSVTELVREDHAALASCYCDQACDTCDFCAGIRLAPGA